MMKARNTMKEIALILFAVNCLGDSITTFQTFVFVLATVYYLVKLIRWATND